MKSIAFLLERRTSTTERAWPDGRLFNELSHLASVVVQAKDFEEAEKKLKENGYETVENTRPRIMYFRKGRNYFRLTEICLIS